MGNSPVTLRRPATLDRLRAKQRPQRVVEIHLDPDVLADVARLEALDKPTPAEKRELTSAREQVEGSTVEMLLRAVGRKRYDDLLLAHPPTTQQEEEHAKRFADVEGFVSPPPYDPDTFAPALIAATCVEPKLSESEVAELLDEWTSGEVVKLWTAALEVNTQSQLVSLGKGSSGTHG